MGDDRIAGCAYSANSAKAYCDFLLTGIYIAGHEVREGILGDQKYLFNIFIIFLRVLRGNNLFYFTLKIPLAVCADIVR